MHHDDDESDNKGRIYYSGFDPDACRADYALPRGTPALQDGDAEFECRPTTDHLIVSRRKFVAACLGVGLVSATATYVGLSTNLGTETTNEDRTPRRAGTKNADGLIQGARRAATGSLKDLVNSYGTFIMVVEDYEQNDPVLWDGIDRLAKYALAHRDEKGVDIAKRLLGAFEHVTAPPHLASMQFELEDLVWQWNRKR